MNWKARESLTVHLERFFVFGALFRTYGTFEAMSAKIKEKRARRRSAEWKREKRKQAAPDDPSRSSEKLRQREIRRHEKKQLQQTVIELANGCTTRGS